MTQAPIETSEPAFDFSCSRLFANWLSSQKLSLAVTTYQSGSVLFFGSNANREISVFHRVFARPMAIASGGRDLWISARQYMWRLQNFLETGESHNGFDAVYLPIKAHLTGDVDVHDIHVRQGKPPLFVATRFNTIATLDETHSFVPVWTPPFIDRIAAEDRCHMNGMAVQDDLPRFVTVVSPSNSAEGWRQGRQTGGAVIDVQNNTFLAQGLSMPHSPRLYQGKLWLINSGTGEFGTLDQDNGQFEPICFLPGFARGLAFSGDYAVIGLSRPRNDEAFADLEVSARLEADGVPAMTGLIVVNLKTGDAEHRLTIKGSITELYDVACMPNITMPSLMAPGSDETLIYIKPGTMEPLVTSN